MERKCEYFEHRELEHKTVESRTPKRLFPQESDWTCAIACIRTMLSGIQEQVPTEQEFIEKYHLTPGPRYSRDIKALGLLKDYDAVYGCDTQDTSFDMLLDLMSRGYHIMVESMYNYAHWFVLLGYFPLNDEKVEHSQLLVFDPYYNKVRLLIADEFISMWIDGNYEQSKVIRDFIAVKSFTE